MANSNENGKTVENSVQPNNEMVEIAAAVAEIDAPASNLPIDSPPRPSVIQEGGGAEGAENRDIDPETM